MKIRTILGLTLIGTAAYAHKQHGGELSLASVKQSLRDLWAGIQGKASAAKDKAEDLAGEVQAKLTKVADRVESTAKSAAGTTHDRSKAISDNAGNPAGTSRSPADPTSGFGPKGYPTGGANNRG